MSRTRIHLLQEISDLKWKNRELQKEIDLLKGSAINSTRDGTKKPFSGFDPGSVTQSSNPKANDLRTMRDAPPIPKPKKKTETQPKEPKEPEMDIFPKP